MAVQYGSKGTTESLLKLRQKLGINIEERTNTGTTILHLACKHRDMDIVNLVHKALKDINSNINTNAFQ